jgi:hypothetical protein
LIRRSQIHELAAGSARPDHEFDDLADVPAQRFGVQRAADGDRRCQHVPLLELANSVSQAASLTGSPITVYSKRA